MGRHQGISNVVGTLTAGWYPQRQVIHCSIDEKYEDKWEARLFTPYFKPPDQSQAYTEEGESKRVAI